MSNAVLGFNSVCLMTIGNVGAYRSTVGNCKASATEAKREQDYLIWYVNNVYVLG
ncbi:hypothetical protein GH890_32270 [Bacillus thuringiensis]|nr:hypothetical protein [Bacillus thuringiensis]